MSSGVGEVISCNTQNKTLELSMKTHFVLTRDVVKKEMERLSKK